MLSVSVLCSHSVLSGMSFTDCTQSRIGETARPEIRGFLLCFVNSSIVFGQWLVVYASA
jgi:hypothetical protein